MLAQRPPSPPCPGATRRSFLASAAAAVGLGAGVVTAAEPWPSRPITLTMTSIAGSGPDTVARDLAARIGMALGQPIVVENVPGAGGILAMEKVRRAAPDGHNFVFTHIGAVVINPALFKSLPYDPVRDFEPVSLVLTAPMILVASSSLGIQTLDQLQDHVRRKPGAVMYGSAGVGTPPYVFIEQLKAATGLAVDHVPFKGSPGLMLALTTAQISLGMEGATALMPLIQAGKVQPLAVSGDVRMEILPQVPTFAELGVPNIGFSWLAVMAPKGALPEAVTALNRELTRVLALPDLRRSWAALGRRVEGGSPEVLAERIRVELPRWRAIIERAGIRPE